MQAALRAGRLELGPGLEDAASRGFSIVMEHGRRNAAMRVAGLLPVVCPIADGSAVTGIGIFDLSFEDTQRVMDGDPGVRAGLFTYELHPCWSIPGSTLPNSLAARGDPTL